MHCLYCDRPLALIKRLTGDGEFCSKECRKNYQREQNELALARLLETQPKAPAKPAPSKPKAGAPAPIPEPRAAKPPAPLPAPAGFFTEYPANALAVSESLRSTGGPRFAAPPPPRRESQTDLKAKEKRQGSAQPRTALYRSEPIDPHSFGVRTRSSSIVGFKLSPALPALDVTTLARCQPGGAESVPLQPTARDYSGSTRHPVAPQFRTSTVAERVSAAELAVVCGKGLRSAEFIPIPAIAQPTPGAIRRIDVEPRWKPLQSVLPERIPGKIVFVLGTFLRRPVRTAGHDSLPDSFEIPLRPVSFPPFSPGMACLEERMHRTDRIGFSPP